MQTYRPTADLNFATCKYDGHYTRVFAKKIFSAKPVDITADVGDLPCFAPRSSLLRHKYVDGELFYPGKPASYVKTAIKRRDPKLLFRAFYANEVEHGAPMQDFSMWCTERQWRSVCWTFAGDHAKWNLTPGLLRELFELEESCEGIVFNRGMGLNEMKWKPTRTIELIVKGYVPGKGQHSGKIGSIICRTAEGFEVAKAGGMTKAMRAEITEKADALIGSIVEVAYERVEAKGRLRHPRFVRFRDDRRPEQCRVTQDEDLQSKWQSQL